MAITDDNIDGWKLKQMNGYSGSAWWQKKGKGGAVATIRTPGAFGDNAHYSVQNKKGTVVNGQVPADSDTDGLYDASKEVDKHLTKKKGW